MSHKSPGTKVNLHQSNGKATGITSLYDNLVMTVVAAQRIQTSAETFCQFTKNRSNLIGNNFIRHNRAHVSPPEEESKRRSNQKSKKVKDIIYFHLLLLYMFYRPKYWIHFSCLTKILMKMPV